jgi:hypothetical protein
MGWRRLRPRSGACALFCTFSFEILLCFDFLQIAIDLIQLVDNLLSWIFFVEARRLAHSLELRIWRSKPASHFIDQPESGHPFGIIEPKLLHTLRKEFGSLVNLAHGIHAAKQSSETCGHQRHKQFLHRLARLRVTRGFPRTWETVCLTSGEKQKRND